MGQRPIKIIIIRRKIERIRRKKWENNVRKW
jgi:hypothetical protein